MKNMKLISLNRWFNQKKESVLLFDSIAAANEIALMLNGEWDGCNGVVVANCDEIAVDTAAKLSEARWCYQGAEKAMLVQLKTDELLRRYAIGERIFINANLRCAQLASTKLSQINLSYAQLTMAEVSQTDLTQANLAQADLTQANLRGVDLSQAQLTGANLNQANLAQANLRGANLVRANLTQANLTNADLTGANLALADLTGVNFHLCNLSGVNLAGAKLIETELACARQC
jgi:uncharacterized protein YjbI with pentapeptide repeats